MIVPAKGAHKPIHSNNFQDRFWMDLVDMTKLCMQDPYHIVMHWIMTIKDHAAGFTYLVALPQKRESFVAHELSKLFEFIGYPLTFHTSNGSSSKTTPSFKHLSVVGWPRTPHDQGSVVRQNKSVKCVLISTIIAKHLAGENINSTTFLGNIMATINTLKGRMKSVEPYKAVTGLDYHPNFSCSKEEAWQCYTVKQQLKVTADVHFLHRRDDNYVLKQDNEAVDSQNEDEDDVLIWLSESVPFDMSDVEDANFEAEAEIILPLTKMHPRCCNSSLFPESNTPLIKKLSPWIHWKNHPTLLLLQRHPLPTTLEGQSPSLRQSLSP